MISQAVGETKVIRRIGIRFLLFITDEENNKRTLTFTVQELKSHKMGHFTERQINPVENNVSNCMRTLMFSRRCL
jgi:hypothetical protein